MLFIELYNILKRDFYKDEITTHIPELNINIEHHPFVAENTAKNTYNHPSLPSDIYNSSFDSSINSQDKAAVLNTPDSELECNYSFQFHIIKTASETKSKGTILLFHGLNEKKWDKYLPWACELAMHTGKAILLFPISFHMDRAPELWDKRTIMNEIAKERANAYVDNSDCSYVNAAISYRLEKQPERIFWSGLQTYRDTISLIEQIQEGKFNSIDPNTSIDLFGYSIGAFFSTILMMANPKGFFDNSKFFCFCGGMTMDRIHPISKYIMDARSSIVMQKTFASLLSSNFAADPSLAHYQDDILNPEESWFKTLLRYNYFQERREKRMSELSHRIKALLLEKDTVTPAFEALNTLKGGYRNIPTEVEIVDFEHPYSHVTPFPLTTKNAEEIDKSFKILITTAVDFLK